MRRPFCAAAIAKLMTRCLLPTLGGPRKTTFLCRSTKPSSCRLSICSRHSDGGKPEPELGEPHDGGEPTGSHGGLQPAIVTELDLRAD